MTFFLCHGLRAPKYLEPLVTSYEEIAPSERDPVTRKGALTIATTECIATCLFIFVSCMGCVQRVESEGLTHFQKSVTTGMAVMIAMHVKVFGHISGAHVNPITSICAFVVNKISVALLPVYVLSQMIGAFFGYGLLTMVTPEPQMYEYIARENTTFGVCVTFATQTMPSVHSGWLEFILAAILTLANCAVFDPQNVNRTNSLPLVYGCFVAGLNAVAGPGVAFNPIRSFGPSVWNNYYTHQWIYWFPPITSSIVVSIFYRVVYMSSDSA